MAEADEVEATPIAEAEAFPKELSDASSSS
jgi:hypothetical protein